MSEETKSRAVDTLIRMAGHASEQANQFVAKCSDDEVLAFAACENGNEFAKLMDGVLDRLEVKTAAPQ